MLSDTMEKELTSTNKVSNWSLELAIRDKCPGQQAFFISILTKHVCFLTLEALFWPEAGWGKRLPAPESYHQRSPSQPGLLPLPAASAVAPHTHQNTLAQVEHLVTGFFS